MMKAFICGRDLMGQAKRARGGRPRRFLACGGWEVIGVLRGRVCRRARRKQPAARRGQAVDNEAMKMGVAECRFDKQDPGKAGVVRGARADLGRAGRSLPPVVCPGKPGGDEDADHRQGRDDDIREKIAGFCRYQHLAALLSFRAASPSAARAVIPDTAGRARADQHAHARESSPCAAGGRP